MTLVEDYLAAVALLLPKAQRDDIIAELRDTILSEKEGREAALARPLTEAETEALLREIGHPLVVAARYREGPQHLIGPALFPYWAFAVKVAVTVQVAVAAIVFLVRAVSGGNVVRAFDQAIGSSITGAVTLIGFATIGAWIIEQRRIRIAYFDTWRVRDLDALRFVSWDLDTLRQTFGGRAGTTAAVQQTGRGHHQASPAGQGLGWIASGTVLVLWWLGLLHFGGWGGFDDLRGTALDPGPLATADWQAIKQSLFWPFLAFGVLVIVQGCALLARPRAFAVQGMFDLCRGALVLGMTAWIWLYSPIASAVQVDSFADLADRLRHIRLDADQIALTPLVTIFLIINAIGGVSRMLTGLWKLGRKA